VSLQQREMGDPTRGPGPSTSIKRRGQSPILAWRSGPIIPVWWYRLLKGLRTLQTDRL